MKRLSIIAGAGLALFLCGHAKAMDIIDVPILRHGTPVAVSVATAAYTNVTSTSAAAGVRISLRTYVLIDNPSTNTSTVHGHIGSCDSTSISTSSVKGPIEIAPGSNGGCIALGTGECIWLVSRNGNSGGAESVTVQDVSQRYGP